MAAAPRQQVHVGARGFPWLEAEGGTGRLSAYLVQVVEHLQGTPPLAAKPAGAHGPVFKRWGCKERGVHCCTRQTGRVPGDLANSPRHIGSTYGTQFPACVPPASGGTDRARRPPGQGAWCHSCPHVLPSGNALNPQPLPPPSAFISRPTSASHVHGALRVRAQQAGWVQPPLAPGTGRQKGLGSSGHGTAKLLALVVSR